MSTTTSMADAASMADAVGAVGAADAAGMADAVGAVGAAGMADAVGAVGAAKSTPRHSRERGNPARKLRREAPQGVRRSRKKPGA